MNFKMCGGLFSFCFLHEAVFGNGQIAITHNGSGIAEGGKAESPDSAVCVLPLLAIPC